MDAKAEIGKQMRRCRERTGMTQAEAAYNAGMYSQIVSKYESGKTAPGIRAAIALADAYGVTLDELVGRNMET